jgi:hypothetical protein
MVVAKILSMMRKSSPLPKAAGGLALLIVIVSAVFVIAHQCHGAQGTNIAAHQVSGGNGSTHGSGVSDNGAVVNLTSAGFVDSSLIREIGASIFFFFLILGGKFLLRVLTARYRMKCEALWVRSRLLLFDRRLGTGLSLHQLGICRI